MSKPSIDESDVAAVIDVLRSGQLALGPQATALETAVAAFVGSAHAVAVSSGTAGLHLAAIAAGIGPGDEVVTTPFSFIASSNCFVYEGARPVFADIDPMTLMPSAAAMEAAVTKKTRAVLTVDIFGNPADADGILAVAAKHGLPVIADACEALGSEYKGRRVGSLADISVFGFYPNKQITAGEGGMITTSRAGWDALLRSLRNQGRDAHGTWLTHERIGFNYRLDEMSAALALSQFRRIDALIEARGRVAAAYTERISRVLPEVQTLRPLATTTRLSWYGYVILLPRNVDRDELIHALAARGVPTRTYFNPLHLQPAYRERFGFRPGQLPIAEDVGRRCLALPFHAAMRDQDVDLVCDALQSCLCGAQAKVAARFARGSRTLPDLAIEKIVVREHAVEGDD